MNSTRLARVCGGAQCVWQTHVRTIHSSGAGLWRCSVCMQTRGPIIRTVCNRQLSRVCTNLNLFSQKKSRQSSVSPLFNLRYYLVAICYLFATCFTCRNFVMRTNWYTKSLCGSCVLSLCHCGKGVIIHEVLY